MAEAARQIGLCEAVLAHGDEEPEISGMFAAGPMTQIYRGCENLRTAIQRQAECSDGPANIAACYWADQLPGYGILLWQLVAELSGGADLGRCATDPNLTDCIFGGLAIAGAIPGGGAADDLLRLTGDHIVLGLKANGLADVARIVGGRTLLHDPLWRETLQVSANNRLTRFTVSLDGLTGADTASQVMEAASRGALEIAGVRGMASATDWEMAVLYQAGRLQDVTFVRSGQIVANPFVGL